MIREITKIELARLIQDLNAFYDDSLWLIIGTRSTSTKVFVGDIANRVIPKGLYLCIYNTEEFAKQVQDDVNALGENGFELCCIEGGDVVLILIQKDED